MNLAGHDVLLSTEYTDEGLRRYLVVVDYLAGEGAVRRVRVPLYGAQVRALLLVLREWEQSLLEEVEHAKVTPEPLAHDDIYRPMTPSEMSEIRAALKSIEKKFDDIVERAILEREQWRARALVSDEQAKAMERAFHTLQLTSRNQK